MLCKVFLADVIRIRQKFRYEECNISARQAEAEFFKHAVTASDLFSRTVSYFCFRICIRGFLTNESDQLFLRTSLTETVDWH